MTPDSRGSRDSRGSVSSQRSHSSSLAREPTEQQASTSRREVARPNVDRETILKNRYAVVCTRSPNKPKNGTSGEKITLEANYLKIAKKPAWKIYQYHATFNPEIEMITLKKGLLSEHRSRLGGYMFDGSILFMTSKLPDDVLELTSKSRKDEVFKITIKYVGTVEMNEWRSLQILNIILRSAMEGLNLKLVGRNFYDPIAKIDVAQHRLQLWPGYITSIRQHERDILVCVEISHKVMRLETIYDILNRCMKETRDYQTSFKEIVLGMTVLTDYNNNTYRIDDIDFHSNPKKTFDMKGKQISFIDYYNQKYKIKIRDYNQPLLITMSTEKDRSDRKKGPAILIPELCRPTGLSDHMRTNFQLMRSLAEHTRMGPEKRAEQIRRFSSRLSRTESSMKVLKQWNLSLEPNIISIPGRLLKPENIVFGNNKKESAGDQADWTRCFRDHALYSCAVLERWFIIVPNRSDRNARSFLDILIQAARGMKMEIRQPKFLRIHDDRKSSYTSSIESCAREDPQMVMCIVPNNMADRYGAIKKKAYIDRALPVQVMQDKTITPKNGNPRSLMSIATKVAIQMNCKLGGAAWLIEVPVKRTITIGYDVCRDSKDRNKSYGAVVATMDMRKHTHFFSSVSVGHSGDSLSNDMIISISAALREYEKLYNELPMRIILYRDGVGEGQIKHVVEHEVKNLVESLNEMYKKSKNNKDPPKFAFIIVTKKINTRLFFLRSRNKNPQPGTVVDEIITLPERYDFYLVSQSVRQGTVSPTSYNVVFDTSELSVDYMQIFTYKMTHLYYNWSGTTRVPAVCQYAQKLAQLVAQHLNNIPSKGLDKLLYFL